MISFVHLWIASLSLTHHTSSHLFFSFLHLLQIKGAMDIPLSQIKPIYSLPSKTSTPIQDSQAIQSTLQTLSLRPHIEGGYFAETDIHPLRIPNPHTHQSPDDTTRAASSSIIYFLTPRSPLGAFHRNASRTVHTLHRGRARYVILHADEASREGNAGRKVAVESFVAGAGIERGERLQWVVDGGKYKASYLLPDTGAAGEDYAKGEGTEGLLISEVSSSLIMGLLDE